MPGIANTMREFKKGTLHSGSKQGPVVKNPKQAVAIAINEKRRGNAGSLTRLPALAGLKRAASR